MYGAICSSDGTGRLDRLKICCGNTCGFKSHLEHQCYVLKEYGVNAVEDKRYVDLIVTWTLKLQIRG